MHAEKCPLCQAGKDKITLETKSVFGNSGSKERAFFQCGSCDVYFQWPRLTAEEEALFYKQEFEKFMASRNASGGMDWTSPEKHIQTNQGQRDRREKYLKPYYERCKGGGSLLEVGCSSGFMLYGLEEKFGLKVYGVEPSGVFSEYLKKMGIKTFEDLDAAAGAVAQKQVKGFDIIMHFFVLEHIQSLRDFLLKSYEILAPGGSMIMEIPNAADPLLSLFKTNAFDNFYWSIAHPWYFTEKALNYTLQDLCGFKNFEILFDQRYDIGNHVRWMREGKPGGQWMLHNVFDSEFDEHYKRCLIQAKKCDTMVAVVHKR